VCAIGFASPTGHVSVTLTLNCEIYDTCQDHVAVLRENLLDDVPVNVGQTAIDTVLTVDQASVINSEQVQNGGVEVVAIGLASRRYDRGWNLL